MTRIATVAAILGLPLSFAASAVVGGPARADSSTPPAAPPALGGWNVAADGNAVDILVDNLTGLAGVHPLDEADFPAAQTSFQTGPFGSALASVFWPGGAGGDFGSLSSQLGFPSQLQPLTSQLNDPVRATAEYPAGPASSTYPASGPPGAAEMTASAQAGGVTATGAITDQSPSSVLHFGQAKGTSSSTAASTAVANSDSYVGNVSLLGGLVTISSIESTATASSDGNTGTGSAVTHVSGVSVLGQPASIGSDGLVLPNFASTSLGPFFGPIVQTAVNQAITGLGLSVTEFPSVSTQNGASYSVTSGGVAVSITPPAAAAPLLEQAGQALAPLFPSQAAIIPTLPGLLQGYTMTITLGRATASSDASPPFNDSFNPPVAIATPPPSSTATPATDTGGSTSVAAAPVSAGSSSAGSVSASSPPVVAAPSVAAPPATTAPSSGGTATVGSLPTALVGLSAPLGSGSVALGIVGALLLGGLLWRVARMLLPRDAGPVCPLGADQP